MKKNLRLLCLGLAAATFTCSFAQEDMTSLLKNTDMEQGAKGWAFDGEQVMGKNTKNLFTRPGFYGMSGAVLEAWNGNPATGLGDSYIMQRVGGGELPNGTYVFGAYVGASKQNHRKAITVQENGKNVTKGYEFWSNRDSIQGVYLFANEATVAVGTNNPDWNDSFYESHSGKFNVAVNLTEDYARPGYLTVGLRYEGTNANYVVWDNPTLYYFGEMSEAEALDAMAKIDMQAIIEVADTFITKGIVMQNDTLADLQAAIEAADAKNTTAATLWEDSEALFFQLGMARKSQNDYANLKKNIETATEVYNCDAWQFVTEDYLPMLGDFLKVAEEAYAAKEMDRAALTELRNELNYYVGAVKIDSVWQAQEALWSFIDEVGNKVGQPGGYSEMQLNTLNELNEELNDTLELINEVWGEPYNEEYINPNNYWPYVARIYAAIENVKNNPISMEYTRMPIEFKQTSTGWFDGVDATFNTAKNLVAYTSPMYRFEGKISNFRITVKKNKNGGAYFCLSELEFFDGNGAKIAVDETMLSSNADHNTLNPGAEDGGGIAALFDGNYDSFFHSAWQNMPSESHYLEVNLPNGGYDVFSFRMVSRANNGYDQSHTFPGEMIISTPMPKRDALEATVARAKALNAYSGSEIGFYANDFSYLTDAIAAIEAALVGYPSENECDAMDKDLKRQINKFESEEDKSINLPVEGKEYHLVSGYTEFYNKQTVEKAITIHTDTIKSLWWENAAAANALQKFVFEPIMEDGEPFVKEEVVNNSDNSTTTIAYYAYTVKNVGTGLYVDSAFIDNKLRVVEQATDTVFLKSLGRGQWNIIVKGSQLHCGDHNGGNVGGDNGAYGGTWGVSSAIVSYGGGLDGCSAWFIREMPTLPLDVKVAGTEFKSACYHFDPANTITLTANKACAFKNLALYDLLGNAIEVADVVVEGNKATITVENNIVGCAFAFTNSEGVSTVSFNAFQYTAAVELLQAAYDAAVAVAPIEGNDVMQYADITEYTAALAKAEAMIESGAPTEEAIAAMIAELEAAVAALKPNMPVAGKYYHIYSALDKFENNHGYKMTLYTKDSQLWWANENELEWNRLWQFEAATEAELNTVVVKTVDGKKVPDTEKVAEYLGKAFYIKSVATGKYIGKADGASTQLPMASTKSETVPYTITSLQEGNAVAIAGANNAGHRLHGAGHGEGKNKSGSIVYWNSGLGTASMWAISEAQYDATDIDFTEIEDENKAVVKGTFDLFGRRVVAPTAPGIYIVDGKKKYIKK